MSKDAYYFKHDSNSRNDPKMVAMMSTHGLPGYARYFIILEILRDQKDYRLPLSTKYGYAVLGKELQMSNPEVVAFIKTLTTDFDLFKIDENGDLYSESFSRRMESLDSRRAKNSENAKSMWANRKNKIKKEPGYKEESVDYGAPFGPINEPAPFENLDEILKPKKKTNNGIDILKNDSLFGELINELLSLDEFKHISPAVMINQRNACLDWLQSSGKTKKDYKAFFRNWLRKSYPPSSQGQIPNEKIMVY